MSSRPDPSRLGSHRLANSAQMALIIAALALVLALPAWFIAGTAGMVWALLLVAFTAVVSGHMPSRLVLARAGASPLSRQQAPGLYAIAEVLFRRAGLDFEPALFYVPSGRLNAFAVGTSSGGGIAVTDGLLRALGRRELAGVLAHEISHLRHDDTRVMSMAAAMTQMTVFLATLVQVLLILALPWALTGALQLPWLVLFAVALSPTASTLLHLALSRNREYTADLEAAALTGDPQGLARALEVLERHNSAWLESVFGMRPLPIPWLQTHPPTAERVRRLMDLTGTPAYWSPWFDSDDFIAGDRLLLRERPPHRRPALFWRPW